MHQPSRAARRGRDLHRRCAAAGGGQGARGAPSRGRHGVPVLQPLRASHGLAERRARPRHGEEGSAPAGGAGGARPARARRPRRQGRQPARRALRRSAAARRHRPCPRDETEADALRRAHLGARSRDDQRGPRGDDLARPGGHDHGRRHPRDGLRPPRRRPRRLHGCRPDRRDRYPRRVLHRRPHRSGTRLPVQDPDALTHPPAHRPPFEEARMTVQTRSPHLRRAPILGAAVAVLLALTACAGDNPVPGSGSSSGSSGKSSAGASGSSTGGMSAAAHDAVIKGGLVASSSDVSGNAWASKIKKAGVLKRGGTDTGALFSLKDPATGKITGFDAGIGDLLARYIIGNGGKTELTQTTDDSRETLLQNNSVDVVVATYSITPERAKKVVFAGPFYTSGDSILVKKSNTDIKSYKDLAGKAVATEGNSTAVTALEKYAPDAKQLLFQQDADCVAAVKQGRADAYVLDESILLSDAVTNPDLKVVGEPFTVDPYGVGVTKSDASAKQFVNAFLQKIEADGTWAKLWKATVGTVVEGDAPPPPKIGGVPGS